MVEFVPVEQDAQFIPLENDAQFVPIEDEATFEPAQQDQVLKSAVGDIAIPAGTSIDPSSTHWEKILGLPDGTLSTSEGRQQLLQKIKEEPGRLLNGIIETIKYPVEILKGNIPLNADESGLIMPEGAQEQALNMALMATPLKKTVGGVSPSPAGIIERSGKEAAPEIPPYKVKEVSDLIDDTHERGGNALVTSKPLEELRQPTTQAAAKEFPKELTEPVVKETFSREVMGVIKDLQKEGKITFPAGTKIKDTVRDLLQTNIIPPEKFSEIIKKHNVSTDKFLLEISQGMTGDALDKSYSTAGRQLQQLSELRQLETKLKKIAGEIPQDDNTIGNQIKDVIKRVRGISQGTMVAQLATSARNFTSGVGRMGIDTLDKGIQLGFREAFLNPLRKVRGDAPVAEPIEPFANWAMMTKPAERNRVVDLITAAKPKIREELLSTYASDVSKTTGGGALGKVEKAVGAINFFNKLQENLIRKSVFSASLRTRLKGAGLDLDKIVKTNNIKAIPKDIMEKSVADSLEIAFGRPLGKDLISRMVKAFDTFQTMDGWNPFPVLPFPRMLADGMRFNFEFSPLGASRLLSQNELKGLYEGSERGLKIASRALVGSGMLYGAYILRNSQAAGPSWYQLKSPDGRLVDMRPVGPILAPYLFVADVIKRAQDGTLNGITAKDIVQAVAGSNFRTGAGLYLVDQFLDDLAGVNSGEKMMNIVKRFAGDALARFAVPFQTLKDFIAQGVPEEGIVRDTKQNPMLGPAMSRVPFLDQKLPPAEIPTREAPLTREAPALRQLTGVSMQAKPNAAEAELGRLGFSRQEIMPSSGDPVYDSLMGKHMGPLVEKGLSMIVSSPKYQGIESNKLKAEIVREALTSIRAEAAEAVKKEDQLSVLRKRYNSLPKRQRAVIEEQLDKTGRTLNLEQVGP